jgi:hypothetical protein
VQVLLAVRVLNFSLRACASWPFWTAKPDELEAGVLVGAGELLAVVAMGSAAGGGEGDGEGDGDVLLPDPEPEGAPDDDTRSSSCVPSAIGPDVCAGQLPAGFKMAVCPNGIVPGAPALRPPVKLIGSAPWNWHWKSPFSS